MRRETAHESGALHSTSAKVFFVKSVKSVQISFQHAMLKEINNQDNTKSMNLMMKVQFEESYRFLFCFVCFKNPTPLFSEFSI